MPRSLPQVALLTSQALPQLDPIERPLLEALLANGINASPLIWSEEGTDWTNIPLVILRSTWDYHHQLPAFLRRLKEIDQATCLLNPLSLVKWNTDKIYLKTLEESGVATIATEWLSAGGSVPNLQQLMTTRGWEKAIVKPRVSAAGKNTLCVTSQNLGEGQALLEALLALPAPDGHVMIQEYLPAVEQTGEISLMFVENTLTHAVQKRPASGEFRVHEHFGGTTERFLPSAQLETLGREILSKVPHPWLYGRVDLIEDSHGGWRLIELEMVEPSMFMTYAPESAHTFAQAIEKRLNQRVGVARP